jgi:hypothetical protein
LIILRRPEIDVEAVQIGAPIAGELVAVPDVLEGLPPGFRGRRHLVDMGARLFCLSRHRKAGPHKSQHKKTDDGDDLPQGSAPPYMNSFMPSSWRLGKAQRAQHDYTMLASPSVLSLSVQLPNSGFPINASITGMTLSLTWTRWPNASWATTEYSIPN